MAMRKWLMRAWIGAISAVAVAAPLALAAPSPAPGGATTGAGSAGQGLEISPPVVELSADPGQTVTATIRVRNVTSGDLIAKGQADDFGAGTDESGQPKLLLDEEGAGRYTLRHWVSGVPDLRLAPQELKTSTIKITVPANAEPGGHFGVIRFTAVPPDLQGTGVALSASVGSLVLLKVSGAVKDDLSLLEFSTWQKERKHGFFEHGPVDFLVRVKNTGTVHEKPQGTIEVTNTFGAKVASVAVNEKGGNVLPDSIRRFEQSLTNKRLFGLYTAKLSMTYAGDKKLEASMKFWVIPWKLILLLLAGVAALVWVLRLSIRRYNAHIIAKAGRR